MANCNNLVGPTAPCLIKALSCRSETPPVDASVLTPFVHLKMRASGVEITVGNESAPQNDHHAVIKELEFGYSERPICKIKIHDEQGSSFVKFMENLLKDMKCLTPSNYREVELRFGWIKTNCTNFENGVIDQNEFPYYLIINTVDCSFDGGKLMYEIELTDLLEKHSEARISSIWGGSGSNTIHLKHAIRELFLDTTYQPSVSEVQWVKLNPQDGTLSYDDDVKFKNYSGAEEIYGPLGTWPCNNLDKLNVLQQWLSEVESSDGKGFTPMYDATKPGGRLVIREDPKANCDVNNVSPSNKCFRQYLVNGGNKSNVISFTPRYKFNFTNLTSSGGNIPSNGGVLNDGNKNPGSDCQTLNAKSIPAGGQEMSAPSSANNDNIHGLNSGKIQNSSNRKQLNAYPSEAITADLVIVGDPRLPNPILNIGKFVSIIFINPYHLFPTNNSKCGDWLTAPLCNEVITNKKWIFQGATHQISEGKFTTTINLMLAAPGVNIEVGEAFGGPGSDGWCPPTYC